MSSEDVDPSASQLVEKVVTRRAHGSGQTAVPAIKHSRVGRETAVTPAAPPANDPTAVSVSIAAPSADVVRALHTRYTAGQNARQLAEEVGMSWAKLMGCFREKNLSRRDGRVYGQLGYSQAVNLVGYSDTLGLTRRMSLSKSQATHAIRTLRGAEKVKKGLVPEFSVEGARAARDKNDKPAVKKQPAPAARSSLPVLDFRCDLTRDPCIHGRMSLGLHIDIDQAVSVSAETTV